MGSVRLRALLQMTLDFLRSGRRQVFGSLQENVRKCGVAPGRESSRVYRGSRVCSELAVEQIKLECF